MLRRLSILHFAVIERAELDFGPGLTALTGETGAGKSIIVGALNLVLGGRAEADLVRTGCESAEVAAVFDPPEDKEGELLLEKLGLDDPEELVLRRQVQREGRSRAWLNDRPVTASTLGELASRLVDISGQHQHQSLLREENHLFLLDRAGGLEAKRLEVTEQHARLMELARERKALEDTASRRAEREDYLRFQVQELEAAKVLPGEERELVAERDRLRHAGKIGEALRAAEMRLDGDEAASLLCAQAARDLERIHGLIPEAEAFSRRLQSCRVEVEDIAQSLRILLKQCHGDPGRLEDIEERMALLQRLFRKHGANSEEVLAKLSAMRAELNRMEDLEGERKTLEQCYRKAEAEATAKAVELSEARKKAAVQLSHQVEHELKDLGMAKCRFEVAVKPRAGEGEEELHSGEFSLHATGIDDIVFLLSPNPGEDLKPLARIASGGELSRLMLAVKGVLLTQDPVPLSVFDEVDSGIGGAVAQQVGAKIRRLSLSRQVICITHLPQIAAFAVCHLEVGKKSQKGRTFTLVRKLDGEDERAVELARMMAGDAAGSASREAARELLRASLGKANH